jgi:hypothetical protein
MRVPRANAILLCRLLGPRWRREAARARRGGGGQVAVIANAPALPEPDLKELTIFRGRPPIVSSFVGAQTTCGTFDGDGDGNLVAKGRAIRPEGVKSPDRRYSVVVRRGGPDPAVCASGRLARRKAWRIAARIHRASAWTRQLKTISRGRRRGATRSGPSCHRSSSSCRQR